MPSTAFIGVRISWLMLARNSLFARFAASAALLGLAQLRLDALERRHVDQHARPVRRATRRAAGTAGGTEHVVGSLVGKGHHDLPARGQAFLQHAALLGLEVIELRGRRVGQLGEDACPRSPRA